MLLVLVFLLFKVYPSTSTSLDPQKEAEVAEAINEWSPDNETNVWELSGQFEGDIDEDVFRRNGLKNKRYRWPYGVIPYKISKRFSEADRQLIEEAVAVFNEKTCLELRPKKRRERNYVFFATGTGCHTMVGMRGGRQKLVLQTPGCLRHGTILHELMHSVGFYHQQASTNRDEYVKVVWDNIKQDHQHNFKKYDSVKVGTFGQAYDYNSVMHYSRKSFSKNGKDTLVPLDGNAHIGQRNGFSETDVAKINAMYQKQCEARKS